MAGQKGRLAHCYRCIYSWRVRRVQKPSSCPRCRSKLYEVPKIRAVVLGKGIGIEELLRPHRQEILAMAARHGARNVRVFGSVRRRAAQPDSDVDLLVDWVRRSNRLHLERDLAVLLQRDVDVASPDQLVWYAAPTILAEAIPL